MTAWSSMPSYISIRMSWYMYKTNLLCALKEIWYNFCEVFLFCQIPSLIIECKGHKVQRMTSKECWREILWVWHSLGELVVGANFLCSWWMTSWEKAGCNGWLGAQSEGTFCVAIMVTVMKIYFKPVGESITFNKIEVLLWDCNLRGDLVNLGRLVAGIR